ncbi:hypothetical protein [Polyangium sorediatum]|uniref:TolB N-terminal domain-containing protein n=1 Tax=Polyangium sorediatum TaxID=889274 RepID=A0ABT6PBC9_9BACT|nr:hypothetical protein [Polyangium sorediatum]MDI1437435.1 hypothetical protein [Polyangium sorediatum]
MRTGLRLRLTGALLLALGALAAPAEAAPPPPQAGSGRAVVELVLEVEPPDRIIGTALERHLRAELGARDIDVVVVPSATPAAPSTGPRPIARITLHVEHQASGAFLATIRVGDLIMDKRVERTIDLGRIPANGRALAVAASTDELLRASWMELTIADAPAPVLAPPPPVLRAILAPAPPARARPPFIEIGLAGTAVDFFGHRVGFGGAAWVGAWCLSRLLVELRFAADFGLPRASLHGSARADTLGPGLGLAFAFLPPEAPLGVRLEANADVVRVHLIGSASGSATASDGARWTGLAGGTVRGWARTGPIAWTLGVGAVAALHSVAATDDGAAVTAIQGVGGKIDAGLSFDLR